MMEDLGLVVEPRVVSFSSHGKIGKQKLRIINGGPNTREMFFHRGPMLNSFTFETNFTKPLRYAAGFEISAVIGCHCSTNETLVDNVVVHVDGKPYEVRLVIEPMRSKLVVESAKLDFGKVVADENNVLWKELIIYNEGSKEGIFQVSFPATNMILKIDPMSGTIANGGKQLIVVFLAPGMLGEFEVVVSVTMDDIAHNILVTGIVMDRLLELRDPEGNEVVPKVKFPPTYYGEDSTFDATLVNLASDTLAFSMAFLDDEQDAGDGGEDGGGDAEDAVSDYETSNEQEEDGPFYAGKNQLKKGNSLPTSCKCSGMSGDSKKFESLNDVSLRLKSCQECCGLLNPLPTLLTVSPSQGLLKPNEVLKVRFRFSPRWLSGNKGFKCFKMCPPTQEHVLRMTCLASQVGVAFKVDGKLPTQRFVKQHPLIAEGISVPAELSLLPDDFLDLGFCMVGQHRQASVLVYNRSPWLPCKFKIRPLAHFHFSVVEGEIDPNEELKVDVTFLPKQSGTFEPLMIIDMLGKQCSEDNIFVESMKVFHTTKLKVTGSSQYVLGGKMKKPIVNDGLTEKQASQIGMNVEMKLNEISEKPRKSRPSINNFQAFRKNLVSNFDLSESCDSGVMFYVKSHNSVGEKIDENDEFFDEEGEMSEENLNNSSEETKSRNNSTKLPALKNPTTRPANKCCSNEKQPQFDPEYMFTDEEFEAIQRHKSHYNNFINANGRSRYLKQSSASTAANQEARKSAERIDDKNNKKTTKNRSGNENNNMATKIKANNKNNNMASKSKSINESYRRLSSIELEFNNINYALTFLDSRGTSTTSSNLYLPNRFSRLLTVSSSQVLKKVSSKYHEPSTVLQKTDCSKKLSHSQLNFVTIEPGMLDFEIVCAEVPVEGVVNISNNLDRYILFEFETLSPELSESRNVRQVVPPKSVVEVNIVLKPQELGKYFNALPYKINGEAAGYVIVTAFSCLAALELSSVTLELKQRNSLPTDKFIRGYVTISNPLNNKASFTWGISGLIQDLPVEEPSVFVTPMKGVISSYGVLQCEVCCNPVALKSFHFNLMLDVKAGSPSILSCYVELEKPRVSFLTPKIILKDATLKERVYLRALLKNNGMHPAYYRIQDPEPLMELKVGPPVGMVPPGGVEMISIQYLPKRLVWFDISIFIDLKAGRDLELRIISNVEIPNVVLDVTHFKFDQVYCNTTSVIPFVLTNNGNSKAIVGFNLKGQNNFKIKSDGDLERKTLFVKAVGFHMIKVAGKEQVHGTLEYSPTQILSTSFNLTMSLENLLTGKPVRGRSFLRHSRKNTSSLQISRRIDLGSFQDAVFPNYRIQTSKKSLVLQNFVMEPLRIPVDAVVVRQPLVVNVNEVRFKLKTESPANIAEQKQELVITNNNKEGYSVFCLDCNQPDFRNGVFRVVVDKERTEHTTAGTTPDEDDDHGTKTSPKDSPSEFPENDDLEGFETENDISAPPAMNCTEGPEISLDVVYENFRVSGTLRAGQEVRLTLVFLPDCSDNRTMFRADMALVYNKKRYLIIPVIGKVRIPFLTFSPPRIVFQPIPLNTKSTIRVTILAHNYPADTTLRAAQFETTDKYGKTIRPITMKFMNSRKAREIELSVEKKKHMTAALVLSYEEPISFSEFMHFKDGFGNKFQLLVAGSCDNCLLSTCFFVVQNQLTYQFLMKSMKLKEEDLESFADFDLDERGSSKGESIQRCSFLGASLLPTSRSFPDGSLKPTLKKSKQCDSLVCKSSLSLRRDVAGRNALGRKTLRTTFSLPAENFELLKKASTITESSLITVDSTEVNSGTMPNLNNNDNVVTTNVDVNNRNKSEGTSENNNINSKDKDGNLKNGKTKKKTVVRQYEVICEVEEGTEEEEEELIDLDQSDYLDVDLDQSDNLDVDDHIICNNCIISDTCNNSNVTKADITCDNNNSSSGNNYNNSSLDKQDAIFMKECLRIQPIHMKLDHASPAQLRNFGTYFVPDLNTAERMHFEHILITVERWASLHGWADCVRCVKLPNFLRKWSYTEEQSKVSPQNSVSHLEKNFFRDMFIHLTGGEEDVKFVKVLPKDDLERALCYHREFSDVLRFISLNGGCVSHLKPEYLLDVDDYMAWSKNSKTFMSGTFEGHILKSQEVILYEALSLRSWLDVILQLVKITLFKRITMKRYKEQLMPMEPLQMLGKASPELQDQPGREWPEVNKDPLSSNLYSIQERILLTWMECIHNKFISSLWSNFIISHIPAERQLTNFDMDLSDGIVLITILFAHVPHLIDRELSTIYLEPETLEEKLHNATCIVRATRIINLDYHIEAQDIFNPNPLSLLLFSAHLFFHLPSFIAKQKLSILFQLNRPVFRQIELSNPSLETVVYDAFLLGSESSNFSIEGEPNMKISGLTEDAVSSIMQLSSSDLLKPEMKVNRRIYRGLSKFYDEGSIYSRRVTTASLLRKVSWLEMAESKRTLSKPLREKVLASTMKFYHPDLVLSTRANLNYSARPQFNLNNSNENQTYSLRNQKNLVMTTSIRETGELMKTFEIPAKGKAVLYLCFKSTKLDSSYGCLFLVARKTSKDCRSHSTSLGTNMVFNLEAHLRSLTLQQEELIKVESPCYQEQELKIPVYNNTNKNMKLKVYLYSGSQYYGHRKKAFTLSHRAVSMAFFSTTKKLIIKKGSQAVLTLIFLPLAEKIHFCTVILREDDQGDLCYMVCGIGKPPLTEKFENSKEIGGRVKNRTTKTDVHWTCRVGQTIERVVYIPIINDVREEAINKVQRYLRTHTNDYEFDEKLTKLNFNRVVSGCSESNPMTAFMDTMYTIELTSMNFSTRNMIRLPNSKVTLEKILDCHKVFPAAFPLTFRFSANLSGIYKTKVLMRNLSNAYDNRIFEVSCTVLPPEDTPTVKMVSPVGSFVSQDIPITNETTTEWSLEANISGNLSFTGSKHLLVPPKRTLMYKIRFAPFFEKITEGGLVLNDRRNNVVIKFNLVGEGTIASPSEQVFLDGVVGKSFKKEFKVFNPALQRLEFFVQSNMDIFCGDESFIAMPKSYHMYEATITPHRRGIQNGVLTFTASDKRLSDPDSPVSEEERTVKNFSEEEKENLGICRVWYEVEIDAAPGPSLATIEVNCSCLTTTEIEVSISNPLPQLLNFEVGLSSPDLKGHLTVGVGAEETGSYKVEYSPGALCCSLEESISFYHQKTGEFWYKLVITTTPIPCTNISGVLCQLGNYHVGQVVLRNPSVHVIRLTPFSSNEQSFWWNMDGRGYLELPARCSMLVDYTFTPRRLNNHSAKIGFQSEQIGIWEFEISADGVLPEPQQPIELICSPNSQVWHILPFINTTDFWMMVNLNLVNELGGMDCEPQEETKVPTFMILNKHKRLKLEPRQRMEVIILFTPSSLRLHKGWVCTIEGIKMDGSSWDEGGHHPSLEWKFPLVGRAQLTCLEPRLFFGGVQDLEVVACFKTFTNEGISRVLELVLECDSSDDPDLKGHIDYSLVAHPSAMEDLESFVRIVLLEGLSEGCSTRLKFNVRFNPSRNTRQLGDLVITNHRGGCWRYRLLFEAEENVPYRELHMWAEGLNQESSMNFVLHCPECFMDRFSAKLSENSAREFSFFPTEGNLEREGVVFTVLFKPITYGKIFKAKIIIQTYRCKWVYVVHGHSPLYNPPKCSPTQKVCAVQTLEKKPRINFVRKNLKINLTAASSPCKRNCT